MFDSMNANVIGVLPNAGRKSRSTTVLATNRDAKTPYPEITRGMKFDRKKR